MDGMVELFKKAFKTVLPWFSPEATKEADPTANEAEQNTESLTSLLFQLSRDLGGRVANMVTRDSLVETTLFVNVSPSA